MDAETPPLSEKSRIIFKKLEPLFQPGPFPGQINWQEEGVVVDQTVFYDLRKREDRERLERSYSQLIGHTVFTLKAKPYAEKNGSLEGFEHEHHSPMIVRWLQILLIVDELDFQIETMDLVEG